jgi:hypothetical protein
MSEVRQQKIADVPFRIVPLEERLFGPLIGCEIRIDSVAPQPTTMAAA